MRQSRGAGFLEYDLIIGLIVVVVIAVLLFLGPQISNGPDNIQPNLFLHLIK